MFDIGFPELVMILFIALLVFGPGRMAEIGRDLGKALRDFRRATTDVQKEFSDALRLEETEKKAASQWKPAPVSPPPPAPPAADAAVAATAVVGASALDASAIDVPAADAAAVEISAIEAAASEAATAAAAAVDAPVCAYSGEDSSPIEAALAAGEPLAAVAERFADTNVVFAAAPLAPEPRLEPAESAVAAPDAGDPAAESPDAEAPAVDAGAVEPDTLVADEPPAAVEGEVWMSDYDKAVANGEA